MNNIPSSNPKKHDVDKLRSILETLRLNQQTITNAEYICCVQDIYGEKKVQEVCARYHLFHKSDEIKPLKISNVRKLQQGLSEIRSKDLDQFIKKLHQNASLTGREKDVVEALGKEKIAQLKHYTTSSKLPVTLFNSLVDLFREPNLKYADLQFKSSLSLEKISGLPGKYFEHGWLSHQKGRPLEDEERLKIYEEIQTLRSDELSRYCELLTKLLVKKHLYYEQEDSHKIKLGMLVPAPQGPKGERRWYRVSEILDSGWGKFAYRLLPATIQYSEDMPELLLYRSSATFPTAMDSFTSYLNDINILPPGYLSRNRSKEKELKWLTEVSKTNHGKTRPLVITGHSLGGANGQIALINLSKSGQWIDRQISLEVFDSPTISAHDAYKFATWYKKQNFTCPLIFNYYLSQGDPVPLAGSITGSSYLGNYIAKETVNATIHKMHLTKTGLKKRELSGLGPHGRIFFRGKEGIDFYDVKGNIEALDREKKYSRIAINGLRIIGTIPIWGTIGVGGGLKRFFIGRRHHDPVIVNLFRNR